MRNVLLRNAFSRSRDTRPIPVGRSPVIDRVSPEARSAMMARVPSKGSRPEIAVRRALHAAGFRFRIHVPDLPGSPDVVLPRHRTAVFVHGCLWHGHGCRRGRRPATNVEFWDRKIDRNVARDRQAVAALEALGWRVRVIWQCRLAEGTDGLVAELRAGDAVRE